MRRNGRSPEQHGMSAAVAIAWRHRAVTPPSRHRMQSGESPRARPTADRPARSRPPPPPVGSAAMPARIELAMPASRPACSTATNGIPSSATRRAEASGGTTTCSASTSVAIAAALQNSTGRPCSGASSLSPPNRALRPAARRSPAITRRRRARGEAPGVAARRSRAAPLARHRPAPRPSSSRRRATRRRLRHRAPDP